MFNREDTTFQDLRQKSVAAWLEAMEHHQDIEVRGGVRVTSDYIQALQNKVERLEQAQETMKAYLKKSKESHF